MVMQLQFAIAIGQNILDFTEHTIFGHKTKQFVCARRHKILKIIETYVKYMTDNNLHICTNDTLDIINILCFHYLVPMKELLCPRLSDLFNNEHWDYRSWSLEFFSDYELILR